MTNYVTEARKREKTGRRDCFEVFLVNERGGGDKYEEPRRSKQAFQTASCQTFFLSVIKNPRRAVF